MVITLNTEDFEYMWSLNHERNSGIKNLDFPNNYVEAVEKAINENEHNQIVVDASNPKVLHAFCKSKLRILHHPSVIIT